MSDVDRVMADMREWACDNLNDSDAGKICGMLSVVSRHINDIETENSELKDFILMMRHLPHG